MQPTKVTSSEFQQAFGALSDKARHEPVIITKHGRPSLVVMAAEEWERLKRRDRQVGLTTELPEEWVEAVRHAKVPEEFAHLDAELKRFAQALPEPIPGLIIRYSYLCTVSILKAATKARKIAPARSSPPCGLTKTAISASWCCRSHSPPDHMSLAIEIPPRVEERLQLDDARSWVVVSEWNAGSSLFLGSSVQQDVERDNCLGFASDRAGMRATVNADA